MSSFIEIMRFGLPYKKYILLNIFFGLLYAFFNALTVVSIIPILEVIFGTVPLVNSPPDYEGLFKLVPYIRGTLNYKIGLMVASSQQRALLFVIGLMLALFLFKNLSRYLSAYYITFLRNGLLKDIRSAIYQKIVSLPVSYFNHKRKGDILSRISADVNEVNHSFLFIVEFLIRDPLSILFLLVIMLYIQVKLTLILFVVAPVFAFLISKVGKTLKKKSLSVQEEQANLISIIEETISSQKIIKIFKMKAFMLKKVARVTQSLYRYANKLQHRVDLASPVGEVLGVVTIGILLWIGGSMVLTTNELTGTLMLAYIGFAYNILVPAKSLSRSSYEIKKGIAPAQRILELLHQKNTVVEKKGAISKKTVEFGVKFDNVSFSYDKKIILHNLSFEIKKGESLALVGPSGGGKTTVANLLCRFYDNQSGRITIDNVLVKDLKTASLYDMIGMVTQESILFNDTVFNNILIGKQKATKEEVINAAHMSNAHDFIMQLPQQYQTNVGENGNKLSGGQKQRLSVARAILKNPKILILDEATSALDTESEKLVQEALSRLTQKRTSLIIAHRLSTIKRADKILVIKNGTIEEAGTHDNLIARSDAYKKMVELQSV